MTKIKKKILYLNYFNRIVRVKNRVVIGFKRNFKILINKLNPNFNLRHANKINLSNILNFFRLSDLKVKVKENFVSKKFLSKTKHLIFDYLNFRMNCSLPDSDGDYDLSIRKRIRYFIKNKKEFNKKIVAKNLKYIRGVHNRHFYNKYTKLKPDKIKKKEKKRNFFKRKKKKVLSNISKRNIKEKKLKKTKDDFEKKELIQSIGHLLNRAKAKRKLKPKTTIKDMNQFEVKKVKRETFRQKRLKYLITKLKRKKKK